MMKLKSSNPIAPSHWVLTLLFWQLFFLKEAVGEYWLGSEPRDVSPRPHAERAQLVWDGLALRHHRYVVELPLLLGQKLEPAPDRAPEHLTHPEAERPHEVITRGSVPVPDLKLR